MSVRVLREEPGATRDAPQELRRHPISVVPLHARRALRSAASSGGGRQLLGISYLAAFTFTAHYG